VPNNISFGSFGKNRWHIYVEKKYFLFGVAGVFLVFVFFFFCLFTPLTENPDYTLLGKAKKLLSQLAGIIIKEPP